MTVNDITIIKLGGSCFSDKTQPRSLHVDVIDNIAEQLVDVRIPFIIVHGGGSFGHPVAKKYSIHLGRQVNIPEQELGFCETHDAMVELNRAIVGRFLNHGIPAYPVQTSTAFVFEEGVVKVARVDAVDALLDEGFIPVLYGDSVIDTTRGFGIMSGDEIIVELANRLRHRVGRIVYLMDVDGLFSKNPKTDPGAALIPEVVIKDGKLLVRRGDAVIGLDAAMQHGDTTIDVTGGIFGKIKELSRLQRKDIVAFLISGRTRSALGSLLQGNDVPCTRISLLV